VYRQQGFDIRWAARVASLRRDQGLPCARHSQFRPVPQQIHHRLKLSQLAKLVEAL